MTGMILSMTGRMAYIKITLRITPSHWSTGMMPMHIASGSARGFRPWKGGFDRFKANTADFKLQMTLPVGSFPEGASHYGVMDMTGNLFEWVDDWFKGYLGIKLESRRFGETFKVTRGSAWTSFADPYGYTFSRTAQIPSHKHRSIGFRCAKSTITQ